MTQIVACQACGSEQFYMCSGGRRCFDCHAFLDERAVADPSVPDNCPRCGGGDIGFSACGARCRNPQCGFLIADFKKPVGTTVRKVVNPGGIVGAMTAAESSGNAKAVPTETKRCPNCGAGLHQSKNGNRCNTCIFAESFEAPMRSLTVVNDERRGPEGPSHARAAFRI